MNSIIEWDQLETAVDHLADVLRPLLDHPDDSISALRFTEADAIATVLGACRHTGLAAKLMHRWALSEPHWSDDHDHEIADWLAREQPDPS